VLDEGSTPIGESSSVYAAAGGLPFFVALVDHFYAGVAGDPVLLRVYPEPDDLVGARHRLSLFLAQYWGGPRTYDAERGHPQLRMRHARFPIGPAERDAWLGHMRAAIVALNPPPAVETRLSAYFESVAEGMRNRP
jgi:hemoglobin